MGIVYIILSGLFFLAMNILIKLLSGGTTITLFGQIQHYPIHELVLARSLVSFAISASIIYFRKLPLFGNNKKWLISRGISGTIALTLFFYTIQQTPLAIASTIQYLGPIFTVLISTYFLREKIKSIQWLFIGLCFIGVIFLSWDALFSAQSTFAPIWILIGIISALFSGLAYSSIVKLRETDEPINIVIYFPMIAIPIMSLWCLYEFIMPQGIEWLLLLLTGITTQIAQVCMTRALLAENTAVIAPFQYLGAIYASLMGFLIFDERLSFYVFIGIFVILTGVILNTIFGKTIRSKKNA